MLLVCAELVLYLGRDCPLEQTVLLVCAELVLYLGCDCPLEQTVLLVCAELVLYLGCDCPLEQTVLLVCADLVLYLGCDCPNRNVLHNSTQTCPVCCVYVANIIAISSQVLLARDILNILLVLTNILGVVLF